MNNINALLWGLLVAVLGFCAKPQQTVDLNKLKELKDFQTVPLSSLIDKPVDVVCALGPFQTALHREGAFRDRINPLLTNVDFGLVLENSWTLVFVTGHSISLQKINGYLDGLYFPTGGIGLPSTFKSVECTTISRACIMKVPGPVVGLGEEC